MTGAKRVCAYAVVVCLTLLLPISAQATLLGGGFTVSGLGDVRVGANFIDFSQLGNMFGPTNGDILFVSGTGDFSTLATTSGTIRDLDSTTAPAGMGFTLPNFIVATTRPDLEFTLNFIPFGAGTPAGCNNVSGSVCTPPGSPFTITNLSDSESSVAITMRGTVSDGSGDPPSNFSAQFTTQLDMTALEALNEITSFGFVQSSHSANLTVIPIPEPGLAPVAMIVLGGIFAMRRRRARRS
jgi:MYXO-CTERM domain-containing protein